ncbi:MAG: hypothetical protein CVU41_01290 [Chloroflexi bacterium HGW-Chloroflexi-3]|nr:MAG: hypothetical protein CVU41_01290 [Chloroflexi bacterium HGW-Chloroflexi-3]
MSNTILSFFLIFIIIILIVGSIFYFSSIKNRFEIRKYSSIINLRKSIGLSIEHGKGLHISLGKSDLHNIHGAASLVGLETLNQIIDQSILSDNPPVTTAGSGELTLLAQSKYQNVLIDKSSSSSDIHSHAYLTGATNLSYIAGVIPPSSDEDLSTQIFVGNIGPEIGLLLDANQKKSHFSLPATDSLEGQSVSFACSDDALIGEEIFSIPAQMSNNLKFKVSLLIQDFLRWLVIAIILFVLFFKFVGLL